MRSTSAMKHITAIHRRAQVRHDPVRLLSREEWIGLGLGAVVSWLLLPPPVSAECGTLELSTCVNAAQYAFWNGLAIDLWSLNRVLLTLCYQLDVLRNWLVQ